LEASIEPRLSFDKQEAGAGKSEPAGLMFWQGEGF
jgi:hypothetical protein